MVLSTRRLGLEITLILATLAGCASEDAGDPVPSVASASGHAMVFGPGGGSLAGGEVRALDRDGATLPNAATVVADDGAWRLDQLPRGVDMSFEVRKAGYQTTQTAVFTLEGDVERVTFQVPSLTMVDVLASIAQIEVDPALCQIATTITRRGHSLYDGTGTHGEPDATASIEPSAAAGDGPIYFNLVKYDTIYPDRQLTASSHDGGVLWVNAAPGRYTLHATKSGATIRSVRLDCRPGILANASPPWGLQVVAGGLEPKKPGEKGPFD